MKNIFLFILTSFIFCNCQGQFYFGYEKGIIIKKKGDTLRCWIKHAVDYEQKVYYITDTTQPSEYILTKDIKLIVLPYTIIENITVGKKEELFNLVSNGKLKLYSHEEIYDNFRWYEFQADKNKPVIRPVTSESESGFRPKAIDRPDLIWYGKPITSGTDYYLKTADSLYHIKKGNYKKILDPLFMDCNHVYVKLHDKKPEFEDLKSLIYEYNICNKDAEKEKTNEEKGSVFSMVESMPGYSGGASALNKFFTERYSFTDLLYDSIYHLDYLLTIKSNGQVGNIEQLRGNVVKDELLIQKIISQSSGNWIPARNMDTAVDVYVPLIITIYSNKIEASISAGRFVRENGQLFKDDKIGIWDFYDDIELALKINFSNGQLLYQMEDTTDFIILKNNEWVRSKLDIRPRFIGSMANFNTIMIDNTVYPELARIKMTTGIVYLSFEIDTMGKAVNFRALNDIGGNCDKAALKGVKMVPNLWIEAKKDNIAYRSKFILPVRFIIQKNENEIVNTKVEKNPDLPPGKVMQEVVVNLYNTFTGQLR